MIKLKLASLFIAISIFHANAQFNPELAEKSLVKVMVTSGTTMGVCSGFIWKQNSWIVTSLHAMRPNAKIQIVYRGDQVREATIVKVLQDADLVLLKTNIDAKPLSSDVTALTSFHQGSVPFQEKIYAIGYNGGSKGDQTQALEKGHANPETLEFLVRPEDAASLKQVGFPSMSLPIYFLSGSLLPGFSGSPIYNQKNELIGIGDGGLERGLMNVSWCIPAANLTALENSSVTTLPANLSQAGLLYSAEVSIEVPPPAVGSSGSNTDYPSANTIAQVSEQVDKEYQTFTYGDFEFYQTKTRTFAEMQNTSLDPKNMESLAEDFNGANLKVDYSVLNFDVYQDINNGFALAIPEGTNLTYDKEFGMFSVDLSEFPEGNYFDLYFYLTEHSGDPVNDIISLINKEFGETSKGLTEDTKYTKTFSINDECTAYYRFFHGNESFNVEGLGTVGASFYLNVIATEGEAFYSLAICYMPDDREDISSAFENGIDCVNNYDQNAAACEYFESLMQIVVSAHLTTLSSIY